MDLLGVQDGGLDVGQLLPDPLGGRLDLARGEVPIGELDCRASARQATERLKLGAAHADSGYVAINRAGEPYTPDTLTRMWHKLTKAAGVRPIPLHNARHTSGTALHLRGVPLAVIAKWLGHRDASITAKIYAHSQPEELRAASVTLGQVVSSE